MMHVARWKCRTQKIAKKSPSGHHLTTCRATSSKLRHVLIIGKKNLLSSNVSCTCLHNMANFGLLAAEICWQVWGTPANFSGFRIFASLLHGNRIVGISHEQRAPPAFGSAGITLGIGHILLLVRFSAMVP